MKTRNSFFLLLFAIGTMMVSCSVDSIQEEDAMVIEPVGNEQALDKDEAKEEDT